jgi:hypothetical protein
MILSVRRAGGSGHQCAELGPLDTAELTEPANAEIGKTLAACDFFHLPTQPMPSCVWGAPDYVLDVTEGDRQHSVAWNAATAVTLRGSLQYIVAVLESAGGRFVDWQHLGEHLDWDHASYAPAEDGQSTLTVTGSAHLAMQVRLRPDPLGPAPLHYHPIEVIGTPANDIELETPTRWQLTILGSALPSGRSGFRLIGATRRQYFAIRRRQPP